MRMKRALGAATAAALLMTGPLAATSTAQEDAEAEVETGVGSGLVSSTLLGIDIGSLLNLDLLDDESLSTIDPANGEPISSAVFNPLKVTSSLLGPLSLGSVATSTTGAEDRKSVTKNSVAGNIPLPIVSGLLEGSLSSIVDGDGARSSLLAGIGDLDLVGGLLGMGANSEAVTFTSNAAAADAGGVRGLNIPSLELLNLGNLLAGIGLPLEDLPLTDLVGLLDGLGIESILVGDDEMATDDVVGTVTDLVESLDVLSALPVDQVLSPEDCTNKLVPVVGGLLDDVVGSDCTPDGGGSLPVVGDLTEVLNGGGAGTLIGDVVGMLEPIIGGSLPVLDDLNLLEVGGITAGMQATATDSVDTSVADVVANISSLKVAELDILEDLDLTQGLDVLTGVGDTVSGLLNSGLGLDGLLDIDVMEITESIVPDGDYTHALSGLTMLGVNLDPSKILGGVGILQASSEPTAGSILGGDLPLLGGDMLALDGLLEGVTSILTEGLGIEVGAMESEGFFTPVAALPPDIVPPPAQPVTPPADGTLPRTGADTALPAAMAVLLLGAALCVRRLVRTERVDA